MLLAVLATMFAGCQKEESELRGPDGREPASGVRVVIDGEKALRTETTRAGGTKVYFEGGYATGAGLYDSVERPIVEAHPAEGYEVDYFYGGPQNEPKRYDYAKSDSASFGVDLSRGDHLFHCGFKKYEGPRLKLRAVPEEGGVLEIIGKQPQTGYYIVRATPNEGYTFGGGWFITSGDAEIAQYKIIDVIVKMNTSASVLEALFGPAKDDTVSPPKDERINVTVRVEGASASEIYFDMELMDNTDQPTYHERVDRGTHFYDEYTFSNVPAGKCHLLLSRIHTVHYTPDIYSISNVTAVTAKYSNSLNKQWTPSLSGDSGNLWFESTSDAIITITFNRKIMPMP